MKKILVILVLATMMACQPARPPEARGFRNSVQTIEVVNLNTQEVIYTLHGVGSYKIEADLISFYGGGTIFKQTLATLKVDGLPVIVRWK